MSDDTDKVIEFDASKKTLRLRGYDALVVVVIAGLAGMGTVLYYHMEDTKTTAIMLRDANREASIVLKETNREMSRAVQEGVRVQRLSTCILATDQNKRGAEYMKPDSFCNRMAQ